MANFQSQFSNVDFQSETPYSEIFDTFIKTKNIVLRERKYHGSKNPYERVLEKYLLVAFNKNSLFFLPKIVNNYISYTRYSREIYDLEQIVSFFLVTISIPFTNSKDIDKTATLLKNTTEETISFCQNLKLFLFELDWKFIEKLLYKHPLVLKDFPVTPEMLEQHKYGHIFSTITNDISVFARNKKMNFVNRPDVTTPELHNVLEIGHTIKDEKSVGLSSHQLVLYGNHSTKIQHLIMHYLTGLTQANSDFIIIYNFNDYKFTMPLDLPYVVKRFKPSDFNLDPFLIIHEHPETRINLIKALTHIFELLPSEIGTFQGLIADYLALKDKNNSFPASIADFFTFVTQKATQDFSGEVMNNLAVETTEQKNFEISNEEISLDTLENQGPIINRSYQNIENKIKYLLYLTKRKKSSPIPLILRKKGTLYFQATKTNQQEAILAFFLITEIAQTIDPNYTLIILGFDSILSTIHNFSQQNYYRQYIHLIQRDKYVLQFKEFNIRYIAFIQLLGSEINTIWTDTISTGNIPNKYKRILQDNTDLAVLKRSDNQSLLIPFSISEKLQQSKQGSLKKNLERIQRNSQIKFSHLEPLSTPNHYQTLWYIAGQPAYFNYQENIALNISELYFDGLEILEELKGKKYITRQSRLSKTLVLTPEARILINTISNYINQFQSVSTNDFMEMNKDSYNLESLLPGLIKSFLPSLNWELLYLFFQYTNKFSNENEVSNKLSQFRQTIKQGILIEKEIPITRPVSQKITPPDIQISPKTEDVAPGFRQRTETTEVLPSEEYVVQPDKLRTSNSINRFETREIRFKKTKTVPNKSKNLVTFPTFTNNLINSLSQVEEINKLSIGKNKKEFTSVILLGKDIQNNKSSAIYSLIDEFYTKE